MFEAKLAQSSLLKKVLDALREIVEDANLDCSSDGEPLSLSTKLDSSTPCLFVARNQMSGNGQQSCGSRVL